MTKPEDKMAGYNDQVFFFVCLWTDTESRSITHKKRKRPTYSHLDQTSLDILGFIIWKENTIFLWDTAGNPEQAR